MDWFNGLSDTTAFLPHRTCLILRDDLIWLHVVSDALIALAYFAIPLILLYFEVHRRQRFYSWVLLLFSAFILLCGLTHVMGIWTMWYPDYYVEGFIKMLTAIVSLATAATLLPEIPKLLALRSPEELETINLQLQREAAARAAALNGLHEAVDKLSTSNNELERFAYITSHDLKAPLRSIASFATLLQKRYGDRLDDTGHEFLGYIRSGVEQMQALTDDLLQLHRVNTQAATSELIDLESVAADAIRQLAPVIAEHEANVLLEPLPSIQGDRRQLTLLFRNLISNGIKFQTEGHKPEILIKGKALAEGAEIMIRDNGIGIDSEHHQRIFETFRRLHTQDEYSGTGIGLSLCRKIVERHGGRIQVESELGQGSCFRFILVALTESVAQDTDGDDNA